MRIGRATQVGVGTSSLVPVDFIQSPTNISLSTVVTGTVTYTIQHTFDDIFADGYTPAGGNWYNHDNANLVAATSNQNDNYAFPVTATRINQTAGTGTTILNVRQGLDK